MESDISGVVEQSDDLAVPVVALLRDLGDLQLALVGGGIGDVIAG